MKLLFRLAWRYLMGRKLRTFLTTLAVIFGVMVIFGLNGMLPAYANVIQQSLMISANKVDLTLTSASDGAFDARAAQVVGDTPGVAGVSGYLQRNVILPPGQAPRDRQGAPLNALSVIGVDPASIGKVHPLQAASGRLLEAGDGDVAMIPLELSQQTGLGVGDTLRLPSASGVTAFRIVGVVQSAPADGQKVYLPLPAAQALFNLPGEINTLDVLYRPGVAPAQVSAEIQRRLGDGFKPGENQSGSQFAAALQVGQVALNLFGVFALAMGCFIIFNTFRTVVVERRHDIGILRAVGASRRTILGLILVEGLLQGVLGTAIGMAAGYGLSLLSMLAIEPIFEKYLRVPMLGPAYSFQVVWLTVALGIGVTVAGSLYPAVAAMRVTPLEALRPDAPEAVRRSTRRRALASGILLLAALACLFVGDVRLAGLGTLLFLAGLVIVAPLLVGPIADGLGGVLRLAFSREGHIARGNLARQPGRAAITASAMMIGLAILVSMTGIFTSLFTGFLGYLDKSLGADFLIVPQAILLVGGNVGAGPQLAGQIGALPGIQAVATLRLAPAQWNGSELQVIGIDPRAYPQVAGLEFKAGAPAEIYADLQAGRALVANPIFAASNGVRVGDVLDLKTPNGDFDYRVVAIGVDYLNAKLATVYISQANLQKDFNDSSDLLLMANAAPGVEKAGVRAALQNVLSAYPAFTLYTAGEWRQSQVQLFTDVMKLFYVLLVALALPSLIALVNTLLINVLERTREIGVLRAVGATRAQVRRIVLAESLLLSAVGIFFGILMGLGLEYVLVNALNVSGFVLPYFFPYPGILLTVAVGLLFGALAAMLPARRAAQMDVITALHFE